MKATCGINPVSMSSRSTLIPELFSTGMWSIAGIMEARLRDPGIRQKAAILITMSGMTMTMITTMMTTMTMTITTMTMMITTTTTTTETTGDS